MSWFKSLFTSKKKRQQEIDRLFAEVNEIIQKRTEKPVVVKKTVVKKVEVKKPTSKPTAKKPTAKKTTAKTTTKKPTPKKK